MFKKLWNKQLQEKPQSTDPIIQAINHKENISEENLAKIIKAKNIVITNSKYPDAIVFYDSHTQVNGATVTLRFMCNGEIYTQEIKII